MTHLQNESIHFANMRNFVTPVRKARADIKKKSMLYLFYSTFLPFPAHMMYAFL